MTFKTMVNESLKVKELHPTFGAELSGVDFSRPIPQDEYEEIRKVVDKYGVVVLRNTGVTDEAHIEFSRYFGDLDDVEPYQKAGRLHRLSSKYLFDAGNIDPKTGEVQKPDDATLNGNKGNSLFHVDSSFNARRAGHSILVAHKLPPPGTGGETEYADSRTAYDDLPEETKEKLEGVVGNHSLFHSRKTAVPDYFKDLDPTKYPMSKHKMVQIHEWSGRPTLYYAAYVHHLDDMSKEDSDKLLTELKEHVHRPKYRLMIPWQNETDMIIWDNTSVMHRATGGSYVLKYPRDMRRTTIKDMSSTRFGLNGESDWRVGMP